MITKQFIYVFAHIFYNLPIVSTKLLLLELKTNKRHYLLKRFSITFCIKKRFPDAQTVCIAAGQVIKIIFQQPFRLFSCLYAISIDQWKEIQLKLYLYLFQLPVIVLIHIDIAFVMPNSMSLLASRSVSTSLFIRRKIKKYIRVLPKNKITNFFYTLNKRYIKNKLPQNRRNSDSSGLRLFWGNRFTCISLFIDNSAVQRNIISRNVHQHKQDNNRKRHNLLSFLSV